ncbi:MAG TPA: DUF1385 domain-containing protein [Dehalococcoidia bacterium]|nr:DUF1385 domain-containing protein [Dehalococcoidia bacterium]
MAERAAGNVYYGGQAVIEGVMIRGPRQMAIAVRAPDGQIVTRAQRLTGIYAGPLRRLPVVRGIVVLYETLALGIRALTWSSQVAGGRDAEDVSAPQIWLTLGVTLAFVGAVFFAGPVLLTGWIGEIAGTHYAEVAAEGVLRLAMLVGYIWLIGRMEDVRRVFAYHGAEHRTIHAYEHGEPLTADAVRRFPNAHPRCGTAFLLTVMVISLVVFIALGTPPIWVRLVERLALIPVIASFAYEVLRLGQAWGDNPLMRVVYAPNIWLQKLTTRDPDAAQIEVAIAALEGALRIEPEVAADVPPAAIQAEEPLA